MITKLMSSFGHNSFENNDLDDFSMTSLGALHSNFIILL
jgi:hypothetical protein